MSDPKNIPVSKNWLVGGGELGFLIRNHNWSANPLGPPERWPRSLKTAVRIMLTSRQPMFVWWGRELINLYNDAYKSIIGGKHPEAFGQPASVVWREIWDQVGPRAESTMVKNEGTYDEALLLIMERHGYQEETYYTFSYSPIPDDQGGPGGIFCANTDDTQRIIGERQLALLRELAARTADARTFDEACTLSARSLETNRVDLPFALIYLVDPDRRRVALAGTAGMERGHPAAPEKVDLDDPSIWPFAEVINRHKACLVSDLKPLGALPSGAWARPPRQTVAVPIAPSGQTGKAGVLIVGLNPFRLFDDNYKRFIELVSGQIAASIANAQAYEEEKGRAEALAEIDRTKTAFFSNVSHEFRTPLTLMLGPIEETLADGQALPPALRERMELLHRNALRLLKLVNTLLDFSRIEAGRIEAVYEPTDAASLTADMVSVFRSALERAGLRLIVDTPPLPEPVYIDREMWEKMVLNLLSNAFKFTFEGEIEVALRWAEDHIELKVRDTGIGIPQEELPRLFERFHRVKGARSRTQEGSGIGLALVQELVRMHGGLIEVESKVGEGTTFTVSIPTGAAHLPADRIGTTRTLASTALGAAPYVEEAMRWLPAGSAPSDPERSPERLASEGIDPARMHSDFGGRTIGFRILLADDNTDMREYVRRLLSARWKVEPVADGAAALKRAREHPPDLILSDVMMPGLDGFELLRALRNDPQLKEIPFILLSARAGEESRIEGLEAGADDYLVKPFSARELMARVGAHLELSRLRRETLQNEQKLRAEAERANRFKSEFVSQVSHDLRTPLNAIIGYTELLRGGIYGPIGEEEKPALERIHRNADDLLHLVNNILDLARMESGKLPLDLTPVATIPLLEDLCLEMKPLIDRKGLSLNCEELAPALPLIVSDPLRIKQVVGNLLTNAVKFTEKGEIKVSARDLPAQEEIEIEVSDTGVGITPEALSRVFESFYQAEESRTLGGSGLGLTIVKELVELLKGKIAVRSEYGKGSTFIVSLPYRLEEGKE